jgi:hypothetical protein
MGIGQYSPRQSKVSSACISQHLLDKQASCARDRVIAATLKAASTVSSSLPKGMVLQ